MRSEKIAIPLFCSLLLYTIPAGAVDNATTGKQHHHSVQSIEQRLEKLEQQNNDKLPLSQLVDRINMNGIIEVEAGTAKEESVGLSTDSSDISLATAQLDISAAINSHVNGRITFLYEEGEENGHIIVDEGIIAINGGDNYPATILGGRMYVPFGNFDSHFISDPPTLILGETNDTAVMAEYEIGLFEINGSFFQGAAKEPGADDTINTFTAGCTMTLPTDILPDGDLSAGVSYISNLAATDTLRNETTVADTISDTIDGWSTFVSLILRQRYSLYLEYLAAAGDFSATDFSFSNARNRRPSTWNIEAGARLTDQIEAVIRYGGSDEAGSLLPETETGVVLIYDLFDNTSLTLEYMQDDFLDKSTNRSATLQVAIEL